MLHYRKNHQYFTIPFKFVGEKIQSFNKNKNFLSTFNTIEDILKLLELKLPKETTKIEFKKENENNNIELSAEAPKELSSETTVEGQQAGHKSLSKRLSCGIQ